MLRNRRREVARRDTAEPVYRALYAGVHGVLTVFTRRDWRDQHKIPASGGVLLVANHISNFDPLALGDYIISSGRWPRFLGKRDLWNEPLVGWLARKCGQIPVDRGTAQASGVIAVVGEALAAGKAVAVYPEGTITADPDTWPMVPRSGAARIALATRCPVIPIGQIGANEVIPGKKLHYPRLLPPKTMRMLTGDPIDLSDLYDDFHASLDGLDDESSARARQAVRTASMRIIEAITTLVGEVRDEVPPTERFDMRAGRRVRLEATP